MDVNTIQRVAVPTDITYETVDLGLPSGVKWADRNVGAETPQDNGMYFSWGSTEGVASVGIRSWHEDALIRIYLIEQQSVDPNTITQEMIDSVKAQFGDSLESVIQNYLSRYSPISGTTFEWENTPYCTVDSEGEPIFSKYNDTDGLTTLETMDDAADQWMGTVEVSGEIKTWRMPTSAETMELVNNTTQTVEELNGVSGMRFTSKTNENSIFIPFAGYCSGSLLSNDGSSGYVWSSSVGSGSYSRYLFVFSGGSVYGDNSFSRYDGLSVRGVVG